MQHLVEVYKCDLPSSLNMNVVQRLVEMYKCDLLSSLNMNVEVQLWENRFKNWKDSDLPSTPLEALNNCNELFFF